MFFRLLGALVVADAIDRVARGRPQKYWYADGSVTTWPAQPPYLSATAPGAPPNWYPDPWDPGGLRWWDGRQWTARTAQSGLPALEA